MVIKKDDVFKLDKGINNLTVTIGWKAEATIDACAFLLDEDGEITNDANFVFYNSENRDKAFDRGVYASKRRWRAATRPMSADGSVIGPADASDTKGTFDVDLSKVDADVCEIVFCASIYNEETSLSSVNDIYIAITDNNSGKELCRYNVDNVFQDETALSIACLERGENGQWAFDIIDKGYKGGMITLIDIYA